MKPTLFLLLFLFCGTAAVFAQGGEINILNPDTLTICRGDVVELMQENNQNDANLRWSPAAGFLDPVTDPSPRVQPRFSRYYRVQVGSGANFAIDSIYIDVDSLLVPQLISDTTICQGDPLLLITEEVDDPFQTVFAFSPGDNFADSTDVNSLLIVDTSLVISLVSSARNNVCRDSQSVSITITPARLAFQEDTISICTENRDTIGLNFSTTGGTPDDFRFFPLDGLIGQMGTSPQVSPRQTTQYFISGTINGCFRQDSILVTVDSLPEDMSMMFDPVKDPYCNGDTVRILSPIYDVGDFPFIQHNWELAPGIESPVELYNAFVFAQDTSFYIRRTDNGSCMRFDSILMNVVTPVMPRFLPDTAICAGTPVQITTIFPAGPATLEWMDPDMTLSCTDCLDPIATVDQTTTYSIEVTPEGSECPNPASYTLQVLPPDAQLTFNSQQVCPGTTVRLVSGGIQPNYRYRIVGPGVDTNDPTIQVTVSEATTFTVTTTGFCSTETREVTIPVFVEPTVALTGPSVVCFGDEVTLTATTNENFDGGTFTYDIGAGDFDGERTLTFQPANSGTVTVTYAGRCGTATATFAVNVVGEMVDPVIAAAFANGTAIDSAVFSGNMVSLTVSGLPAGNYSYNWTGNFQPMSATGEEIVVTVPDGQGVGDLIYTVEVTDDDSGCTYSATIFLPVVESDFKVPEVFTPNSDGRNDIFRVFFNGEITDYNLVVFNRWGNKVFVSSDPDESWDGNKDGKPQIPDVYYYIAQFTQNGVVREADGEVMLVR